MKAFDNLSESDNKEVLKTLSVDISALAFIIRDLDRELSAWKAAGKELGVGSPQSLLVKFNKFKQEQL